MFFGINGSEFLLLALLAVVVIGPERLPRYAEQLGSLARRGRSYLSTARERVDSELGDEFGDVDWSKLDPRQYDPRRIVREALSDDVEVPRSPRPGAGPGAAGAAAVAGATALGGGPSAELQGPAPYDDEAT
ncbi:translocase [Paraoerskovia marina]|uniref:Sec-independent protein translocase protein TatB n=1 Tax=Paraoerskovia marina TaxID=545619 RepID=A0A1H1UMR2_9CELL|nr:translocase [Paraoerskovia marina]SDS73620.1 sec-independent protein translocase protein TatB [Paraoerskovia marina]